MTPLGAVRIVLALVTVFGPAAGILAMVRYRMKAKLTDFTATGWDEMENFQSTAAFVRAGFRGGYFNASEDPAPASFTHFSTHGPTFPLVQGMWGKAFGWDYHSAQYFNLAVITIALAIFLWVIRPNTVQLLLSAVTFPTFWPFYEFVPSNMQEPLHFAIGILLGCAVFVLFHRPRQVTRGMRYALFAGILAAALVRSSWALFFVPFFLTGARARFTSVAVALGKAGLATVVSLWLWRFLGSPMKNNKNSYLMIKAVTGETGLATLTGNLERNLLELKTMSTSIHALALPACMQTMALVPLVALLVPWRLLRRRSTKEELFHVFNLASIVGSTLVFYFLAAGGPRVFALHLIVTLVLAIASNRPFYLALVGLVAAWNVVGLEKAVDAFPVVHASHYSRSSRATAEAFRNSVRDALVYRKNRDGWCNTALTGYRNYGTWYTGLPPGIGLAMIARPEELPTVRSRYIIADPATVQALEMPKPVLVKRLSLPPGTSLYLNTDRTCE
jgi:hypothetical protein